MTENETQIQTEETAAKKCCPLCACFKSTVTRRVIARLTDYVLWGMLSLILLYATLRYAVATQNPVLGNFFALPFSLHLFLYIFFIIYIFVEAGLIAAFGKTLGKALVGIKITDENGEKLTFKKSLYRSWLVFFKGMGLFLPLISIIVPVFWLVRYHKTKEFVWDVQSKTTAEDGKFHIVSKIVLILFYAFLAFGMYTVQKNAREFPEMPSEEQILYSYLQAIEPYLKDSLEENALLTPEQVDKTLANLKKAKEITQEFQDKYLETEQAFMQKAQEISNPETREVFETTFAAQKERVTGFFFLQQIRLSLFENIVEFFKSAEGQYTFENGLPVFKTPELTQKYEDYMGQMESFLQSIAVDSEEEITVDEIIEENTPEDAADNAVSEQTEIQENVTETTPAEETNDTPAKETAKDGEPEKK